MIAVAPSPTVSLAADSPAADRPVSLAADSPAADRPVSLAADSPAADRPGDPGWARTGRGFAAVGRALGDAGLWVGRAASSAYLAIDPDVRRHMGQLPLMGLTLLSRRTTRVEAQPNDGHRPIVFVHGLVGHPGNFLPMRKFMAFHGRKRTYALALDAAASIPENAQAFSRFVEEVIRVNDLPADAQIDCVAHSMGGLVVRLAIETETSARIATLVTLGSPHQGTYAARYGASRNVVELRPDSPVMHQLAAQLPWPGPPSRPRLVALWSAADVLLLPAGAACAEGAETIEMRGFTHYSYLLHPRGWSQVLGILSESGALGRGREKSAVSENVTEL
jgi:pimeloyl-ACP methyl ester carboxylesterase